MHALTLDEIAAEDSILGLYRFVERGLLLCSPRFDKTYACVCRCGIRDAGEVYMKTGKKE